MNLLLDTHTLLWFGLGDMQLSRVAQAAINDRSNAKFVSPATYWEIAIKVALGNLKLNTTYANFVQEAIHNQGFRVLHISPHHTERVSQLPFPTVGSREHRDPFDRLLIAQAQISGMSIITDDRMFKAYDVSLIW